MELNRREERVLGMFFEEPLRKFKFKDIVERAGLHRDNANKWIERLKKENMISRVKPKGKFPYYTANYDNVAFRNRKRLYALSLLYESGLLDALAGLGKAEAVVIFGSFARSDWHKNSDIDVFVYGSAEGFDRDFFERKLKRKIEIFSYKGRKALNRINPHLLKNIIRGFYVKGSVPLKEAR